MGGANTIMGSCIATWEDSKGGVTGAKWGRGLQSQENMAERGVNEGIIFASFLFLFSKTIA